MAFMDSLQNHPTSHQFQQSGDLHLTHNAWRPLKLFQGCLLLEKVEPHGDSNSAQCCLFQAAAKVQLQKLWIHSFPLCQRPLKSLFPAVVTTAPLKSLFPPWSPQKSILQRIMVCGVQQQGFQLILALVICTIRMISTSFLDCQKARVV